MSEKTFWNCGVSRYLANSASQSACDSGGRAPASGCHSTMDRPDSVRRVMPPTTTIAKVKAAQTKSHAATCAVLTVARFSCRHSSP